MVHLGHLIPWFLTKHLQDKFDSNLFIQITNDERFFYGTSQMAKIKKNVNQTILNYKTGEKKRKPLGLRRLGNF